MRLLLDTQAFLWFVLGDPRMSATASALVAAPDNDVEISPASYWEIANDMALDAYPVQRLW
jgi:PIN domain nuclease of toxin-antitoxin system